MNLIDKRIKRRAALTFQCLPLNNYFYANSRLAGLKADDVFKKCLKIKTKDPLLLYNYGKFFHDQKNYKKAIIFYNESFKVEPRSAVPLYNIGNIYLSRNDFYVKSSHN